jgi:hypothetical protein
MNSKQRVKKVFQFEIPDRVPVNYRCNPGIDARLKKHFKLGPDDNEGLLQALGVDFRMIEAPYTGPKMYEEIPGLKIDPIYGFRMRYTLHQTGGYWEYCDFPLLNGTAEDAENWRFPDPDDFDYDSLLDQLDEHRDYGIIIGYNGIGLVICRLGFFRGFEQALIDLALDDPVGTIFIDKLLDFQFACMERVLEKVKDKADVMWMGEDLGTQIGPLISMEMFTKKILPRQRRFIDLAASYGVPAMLHTCGCSSWTYEEYIKAGLKAVETLQPEVKDMAPEYLKEKFGGRLVFHGCISTAGALTYGSIDDVDECIKHTMEVMKPGGGYCLAPTHRIQDNTPLENVLCMYEKAKEYGKY